MFVFQIYQTTALALEKYCFIIFETYRDMLVNWPNSKGILVLHSIPNPKLRTLIHVNKDPNIFYKLVVHSY
jgi:hypothetical protein